MYLGKSEFLVSREVATNEVNDWLKQKGVSEKKIQSRSADIDELIDAVCVGKMSFSGEKVALNLSQPLGTAGTITTLQLEKRIPYGVIVKHTKGVDASDAHGLITAYIAAVSNMPSAVIATLDSGGGDLDLLRSYVVFFM